jgi:transcriptional regulator with XRE-family HTH domain
MIIDTMGERIEKARLEQSLTAKQVARVLGVKSTTLSNWENDRSEPRTNKLVQLAGVLSVSPIWLIQGGDRPDSALGELSETAQVADKIAQAKETQKQLSLVLEDIERHLTRLQGKLDEQAGSFQDRIN